MWISSDTPEPELEFDSETKKMMAEVMEQFLLEGEASGKYKIQSILQEELQEVS